MPYFICRDQTRFVVRSEKPAIYDDKGRLVHEKKRRVFAQFKRGLAPKWALDVAQERYVFDRGIPLGVDPISYGTSWYDLEEDAQINGWDEEEQAAILERLRRNQDVVEVFRPEIPLPYGPYLKHRKIQGRRTFEMALADIKGAIEEGYSTPEAVINYEHDHWDQHSEEICKALAAPAPEPEEELIEA